MKTFVPFVVLTLCLSVAYSAEDKTADRWNWLVENHIVIENGQSDSYKRGYTNAIRWSIDSVKHGRDLYWSPLLTDDTGEQQGYFEGLQSAHKVIEIEIASAIGRRSEEVEYLAMGKYRILSNHQSPAKN